MATSPKTMKMPVTGRALSRSRMMFSGRVNEKILLFRKFIERINLCPSSYTNTVQMFKRINSAEKIEETREIEETSGNYVLEPIVAEY